MNGLTYRTDESTGESDYVFAFLSSILGIPIAQADGGQVDLYHGNESGVECRLRIPLREADVLWPELLDDPNNVSEVIESMREDAGFAVPFDLISGIGALLTDRVNRNAIDEDFDAHDRLRFEASFQSKAGYAHVPIVNTYVEVLAGVIENRLGVKRIPLWPEGKRSAIALSHDVDAPIRHGASGGPLYDSHASVRRNVQTNLYRVKFAVEKTFGATGLEHWHFPFIMDAESFRGFTSTFLFAPTRRFDPHGHPDFDVSYDINAGRFRDLFGQMNYRGFEIGLHAGYLAYQDPQRLDQEREKLELIAQTPIRGLRHHVWHAGRNVEVAMEAHELGGFEFDSSVAFNRFPYLRRSVALPYRPWSRRLRRALDVIQVPVALMDGHIFYHPVTDEEALEQAKAVVDRIRDSGGVGAIDWHVRTSSPDSRRFASWGRTYMALLDYLAEFDDTWVTSLGEINDWFRMREKLAAEGGPAHT